MLMMSRKYILKKIEEISKQKNYWKKILKKVILRKEKIMNII